MQDENIANGLPMESMIPVLGEDYHRFFVFSENIVLENNGSTVRVAAEYDVNLMNNLVQCTSIALTPKNAAYRMKVNSLSANGKACILFGLTSKCYIGHPTWVIKNSIRYHSDTGGVFNGGPGLHSDNAYTEGDEVTCHVEYFTDDKSLVNFLKNGRLIFRQWVALKAEQLFPTIGFENGPAEVSVQWPLTDLSHDVVWDDLNQWIGWKYLSVDNEHKTVTLIDMDDTGKKAFSLQAPRPFDREHVFLEMTVVRRPDYQTGLVIGVTGAVLDRFRLPGWDSPGIAYHCHDGSVIHGTASGHDYKTEDSKCQEADRLGCGLIYLFPLTPVSDEQSVIVYFTKNGTVIYQKCVLQPEGGYYPAVGMCTKWDKIKLNFKAEPPRISDAQIKSWSNRRRLFQWFRHYPAIEFVNFDATYGRKVRQRRDQEKVTLVQYIKKALSLEHPYFKVKVTSQGGAGGMFVGVATRAFPSSGHHLGTDEYSCAFSTRHGTISSSGVKIFTEKAKAGDDIGCYLEYVSSNCYILIFTKNQHVQHRVKISSSGERVYASITFDPTVDDQPMEAECWWPDTILPAGRPEFTMTNISKWLFSSSIAVEGRQMKLKKKDMYVCYFNAQSPQPLTKTGFSYFEVRFLISATGSWPSLGVSPAVFNASVKLGSVSASVAYSPAKAEVMMNSNVVTFTDESVYKCRKGDRAGCGIVYFDTNTLDDQREDQSVIVYFTKNGEVLYHGVMKMLTGGLYPTLCFEREGDTVEVLTAVPTPVRASMASEWIKEAKMNLPAGKTAQADFGKELMMDLIEYTDVVDDYKDMYGFGSSESDLRQPSGYSLYISHCAEDAEKAHQILETLTMEGHEVEMSQWNRTLEDVSLKSDDVDAILICLSHAYIHDDGRFQEFIILKSKGKPLVPVLMEKLVTWPPRGNIAAFQSDFIRQEHVRVDAADDRIDGNDLLCKVERACQAAHPTLPIDRSRRPSLPAVSTRLQDHYYPRQRRGLSLHEQATMELPVAGPNGMVRTVVCVIL